MSAPITPRQLGKLHAVLAAAGVHERDEKLRVVSALIYRKVASTKDVTFGEARTVIDLLDGLRGDDAPAERLAAICAAGARYLSGVAG